MEEVFKYVWNAVLTVVVILMTFIGKRFIEDIDAAKKGMVANEIALERYKKDVADTYAKDSSVQQSLGRLHDRIDVVADDIKEILSILANRKGK